MKKFKASNELVEILLKNGFIDTTEKNYNKFYQRMITNNEYDPHKIKRSFSLRKDGRDIVFDYINMFFYDNKKNLNIDVTEINEKDLISIIAYYKLPYQTRYAFLRKGNHVIRLAEHVESARKHPKRYTEQVKKIEESINQVII